MTIEPPVATDEKFELYQRYRTQWHGSTDDSGGSAGAGAGRESFEQFLYDSPVQSLEICYRDPDGKLLGVGICDVCALSLSSVYFYFDPQHARRASPHRFVARTQQLRIRSTL